MTHRGGDARGLPPTPAETVEVPRKWLHFDRGAVQGSASSVVTVPCPRPTDVPPTAKDLAVAVVRARVGIPGDVSHSPTVVAQRLLLPRDSDVTGQHKPEDDSVIVAAGVDIRIELVRVPCTSLASPPPPSILTRSAVVATVVLPPTGGQDHRLFVAGSVSAKGVNGGSFPPWVMASIWRVPYAQVAQPRGSQLSCTRIKPAVIVNIERAETNTE